MESVMMILPALLRQSIVHLPEEILEHMEELRIRENRPLEIVFKGQHRFVSSRGEALEKPEKAYLPTRDDCMKLLDLLTNHSMYTFEEELKRGYITIRGGHRVGIAGRTVLEQGKVKQIRDVSSFNVRVAREVRGAAQSLLPPLLDHSARTVHHTLLVSPPQQGKTTMIRDLARMISSGDWGVKDIHWPGLKVGIVDERSELAACVKGVPRFDVGPRTDVLDSCPKAEGMMMMIRSMSPDVLIVDEIGRQEDAVSIHEALHAGIRLMATAHGTDLQDIRSRPILRQLMEEQIFDRYVVLRRQQGTGTTFSVFDTHGNRIEAGLVKRAIGSYG